jgi:hypothetical protein
LKNIIENISDCSIPKYIDFVGQSSKTESYQEARRNTAVIASSSQPINSISTKSGVIKIYSSNSGISLLIEKKNKFEENNQSEAYLEKFRSKFSESEIKKLGNRSKWNKWEHFIELISGSKSMKNIAECVMTKVRNSRGETSVYISFFNLLGLLSYITSNQTSEILPSYYDKSIDLPIWKISSPVTTSSDDDNNDDDDNDNDDFDENANDNRDEFKNILLNDWVNNYDNLLRKCSYSIQFYIAIFDRFYDVLTKLDDIKSIAKYPGLMMHRYTIAFLNSILVEELKHNEENHKISITLQNSVTDDKWFITNFKEIATQLIKNPKDLTYIDISTICPFFAGMISCPIWTAFINPQTAGFSDDKSLLKTLITFWPGSISDKPETLLKVSYKGSTVEFDNLFDPLNSLLIK